MPQHDKRERGATAAGIAAILLWATLALLTTAAKELPPFEILSLTFGIATLLGLARLIIRGRRAWVALWQPWYVWVLGVSAFFAFHAFYFYALTHAPPAQASLVVYLWPMLIVLFSAALPSAGLKRHHLAGAGLGLLGTWAVLGGDAQQWGVGHAAGYAAAFASALTWSSYSVAQRRLAHVPTEIVTSYCAGTAVLGAACHLAFEPRVLPTSSHWLAVIALGLGPVGAAFFAWDHGMKRGNLPLLGSLSYAAPLVSTVLLVAFGRSTLTWHLGLGTALVAAGAIVASWPRSSEKAAVRLDQAPPLEHASSARVRLP